MSVIQWDGKLLETNAIHSNPPRSHTHMNLYLPRLTRENIFDKQDHTVLGPPGLLCVHDNIRGVVMLLSPILDQPTLCIHFICLNGLDFSFLWLTRQNVLFFVFAPVSKSVRIKRCFNTWKSHNEEYFQQEFGSEVFWRVIDFYWIVQKLCFLSLPWR